MVLGDSEGLLLRVVPKTPQFIRNTREQHPAVRIAGSLITYQRYQRQRHGSFTKTPHLT